MRSVTSLPSCRTQVELVLDPPRRAAMAEIPWGGRAPARPERFSPCRALPAVWRRFLIACLALVSASLPAADPPPVAEVPPEVLAEAAAVAAKKPAPADPSVETLATADRVDALLVAAAKLLQQGETVTAGQRFVSAVQLLEGTSKAERRALGQRYRDQRQQLTAIADRLLADPAIKEALGNSPLAPTSAEERLNVEKPDL